MSEVEMNFLQTAVPAEASHGSLVIVSAPSGGGKTSLVKALLQKVDKIEVSISHTTRALRPGEQQGKDYFFVTKNEFEAMIAAEDFVEYATVFKNYYGTSLRQIQDRLAAGIDVLLDIDWQGAEQIKNLFPQAISVFLVPPSLETLRERLLARGRDKPEEIEFRMAEAREELSHCFDFDYLLINNEFEQALAELESIVLVSRLKTKRQISKHAKVLSFLQSAQ